MLELYQVNWSWNNDTDKWLQRIFENKTILNFPSGLSTVGYRVDLDESVKPDKIADLDENPFKPLSYDAVICDPPFSRFNKWRWLTRLAECAKTDFIISTPYLMPRIKNFYVHKTWLAHQGQFYLRLWIHFKRKNYRLD